MNPISFALPSGSLQDRTLEILRKAGYCLPAKIGRDDRAGLVNGVEFLLRDRETIPFLVASGAFDAGITGSDLTINAMLCKGLPLSAVQVIAELPYSRATNSKTRWVLASPGVAPPGKLRIGTERLGLAGHCLYNMLEENARLVLLSGKEESAIADGLCDAVFVVTETGSSLAAHGLKILRDNLFISTPQLLARPGLFPGQLVALEEIGLALRAVLDAESMITVTFDLPRSQVARLQLPAAVSPTINSTLEAEWVAGQVLIERRQLGHVLWQLKQAGARGVFMQDVQGYMKGGIEV